MYIVDTRCKVGSICGGGGDGGRKEDPRAVCTDTKISVKECPCKLHVCPSVDGIPVADGNRRDSRR